MTITDAFLDPLFGEADGYDGEGYDANGADRNGYDRDGNPKSVLAADLNLAELWSSFQSYSISAFLDYLRGITREPEFVEDVVFCVVCGTPAWDHETSSARGSSDQLCESCAMDWPSCGNCANSYPTSELTETLNEEDVCARCLHRNYSYCDDCDGYYLDGYSGEHEHEEENDMSGCCESPQLNFKIRNDGCEPLANDKRVTVTLPAGIISREGIAQIRSYLRTQAYGSKASYELDNLSYDLDDLGDAWQTKEGNFTKRLSRRAYQRYGTKLDPEIVSQVGCIARDNSGKQNSYNIEITRDLNMSAYAFYHEDSCWWGSYTESRCALKTNGGFGLRTFNPYDGVSGRAWVMPLRQMQDGTLTPTFDTETPDAFVVFNGYGDLAGYTAPRIVGHMAGWTYRKIGFECYPMYVNAGGYLVAPEEIAKKYDGESNYLNLRVHQHSDLFEREQAARELALHVSNGETGKEALHV